MTPISGLQDFERPGAVKLSNGHILLYNNNSITSSRGWAGTIDRSGNVRELPIENLKQSFAIKLESKKVLFYERTYQGRAWLVDEEGGLHTLEKLPLVNVLEHTQLFDGIVLLHELTGSKQAWLLDRNGDLVSAPQFEGIARPQALKLSKDRVLLFETASKGFKDAGRGRMWLLDEEGKVTWSTEGYVAPEVIRLGKGALIVDQGRIEYLDILP